VRGPISGGGANAQHDIRALVTIRCAHRSSLMSEVTRRVHVASKIAYLTVDRPRD